MNHFKDKFKKFSLFISLIISSYNLHATQIVEQTFIIKTETAHLDISIPFKIACPTCIDTIKQDEHTYLLRLTPPEPPEDAGRITFTYYYGDENNSCRYNLDGNVIITEEGRVMGAYFGDGFLKAKIDPKSTAFKVCPPQLNVRMEDTTPKLSTIFVDENRKD